MGCPDSSSSTRSRRRWASSACAAAWTRLRQRGLRGQTRRRVPHVEPVHRRRGRARPARRSAELDGDRRSTSSSAASGSATPRRPCSRTRGCARWSWSRRSAQVIDWHGGTCCPLGAALDRRPALPPGARRLLRAGRRRRPRPAARPAAGSTRSSSTSTTRRATCCTRATPPSTPRYGLAGSPGTAPRRGLHAVVERPAGRGVPGRARRCSTTCARGRELRQRPGGPGRQQHGLPRAVGVRATP